jgi:hypothetical protein
MGGGMGKGSTRRPVNSKKFEDNWDKIFNNKPNAEQFDNLQKKEDWREEIINERNQEAINGKDKPNSKDSGTTKE